MPSYYFILMFFFYKYSRTPLLFSLSVDHLDSKLLTTTFDNLPSSMTICFGSSPATRAEIFRLLSKATCVMNDTELLPPKGLAVTMVYYLFWLINFLLPNWIIPTTIKTDEIFLLLNEFLILKSYPRSCNHVKN